MHLMTVSKIVNAPIGEVWAITSSFGSIASWIWGVQKVSVEGAGVGAVRTVSLASGETARETITELDAGKHRIFYGISAASMEAIKNCVGGTQLTAVGPDRTRLDWIVEADSVEGDITGVEAFLKQFFEESIAGLGKLIGASVEDA